MARKRAKSKRAKKSKMAVGTCRRTPAGVLYCKLSNGKVKFRKG